MKRNKNEDFPFMNLSDNQDLKTNESRDNTYRARPEHKKDNPNRTLSGQIQILSVVVLTLYMVLLTLIFLTFWVYDNKRRNVDITENTTASSTFISESSVVHESIVLIETNS